MQIRDSRVDFRRLRGDPSPRKTAADPNRYASEPTSTRPKVAEVPLAVLSFDAIKRAKQKVEAYAHEKLFDPKVPTVGVKFSPENNHEDWNTKTEQKLTVEKDGAAALATLLFDDDLKDETSEEEA